MTINIWRPLKNVVEHMAASSRFVIDVYKSRSSCVELGIRRAPKRERAAGSR